MRREPPAAAPDSGVSTATDTLASSFATSYAGVVAFMTVVAEGSFAKAGERLGIGRSAVSRGIQRLESQLGARLLSRTTRSLSLTREGEIFHARCHPGVAHILQALEDLRDLREGNDPELVLQSVLEGQGLAQMAGYQTCRLLREGRLVACLPQYAPDDRGHYIGYLSRQHLPGRIRAFVDHMTAAIRALDMQCAGNCFAHDARLISAIGAPRATDWSAPHV